MKSTDNGCSHTKPDGTPCGARPIAGGPFCFFHSPDQAGKRLNAQRAGGLKNRPRTLPEDAPELPLATVADMQVAVARVFNGVLRGEIDPRVGNTAGYLAALLLKSMEQAQFEQRLLALEAVTESKAGAEEDEAFSLEEDEAQL